MKSGRQAIEHHCCIVENVGGQAKHLTLWLKSRAETVRKENCSDATGRLLEHREEECGGRGGSRVTYADACLQVLDRRIHGCVVVV